LFISLGESNNLSTAAIVGVVVGIVALLTVIGLVFLFLLLRKRKQRKKTSSMQSEQKQDIKSFTLTVAPTGKLFFRSSLNLEDMKFLKSILFF
jgi:uncharacterized membrane-anchored protein YhcB (DUF1043 family)